MGANAARGELRSRQSAIIVVANHAHQDCAAAQRDDVVRDVGSPAEPGYSS